MKQLNKSASLHELASQYPEIIEIMYQLGFKEIKIPGMLATAGRRVTIPQGANLKHIDWENMVRAFAEAGFEFVGDDHAEN